MYAEITTPPLLTTGSICSMVVEFLKKRLGKHEKALQYYSNKINEPMP